MICADPKMIIYLLSWTARIAAGQMISISGQPGFLSASFFVTAHSGKISHKYFAASSFLQLQGRKCSDSDHCNDEIVFNYSKY